MRGVDVGEFDHVTHVTLTANGPKVVNLRLDGFVEDDVVNEGNHRMVETLRQGSFLSLEPSVVPSSSEETITTHIHLRNPAKALLQVNGQFDVPTRGWHITPESIALSLNPNEERSLPVELVKADRNAVSLPQMARPELTLAGTYTVDNRTLSLPSHRLWTIDWNRPLTSTGTDTAVDGVFEDASVLVWIPFTPAEYIKEAWDYHGDDDLNGRFSISDSTTDIFVRWELNDDVWLVEPADIRDHWEVWLQGVPDGVATHFALWASDRSDRALTISNGPPGIKAFGGFEGSTLRAEVSIPKTSLQISESTTGIRFNLAVTDHNRRENTKPSVLFWKPTWDSSLNYAGSGVFQR